MENLFTYLATSFVKRLSPSRKFQPCSIGKTGCSLLFMKGKKFEKSKTRSGDDLYFNEYNDKGVVYGVICIALRKELGLSKATDMLSAYMNKLRGPFFVFHQVGQEKAKDWNKPASTSLVDHWQNAGGIDSKLKGYTDGKVLSILYVKNISEAEVTKQEAYLDSFHFKAS